MQFNLQFDPAQVLKTRQGEAMQLDGKDVTLGWLAVYALDNIGLDKCTASDMRRRFRITGEIQDAEERGAVLALKNDEHELIDEMVLGACKKLQNGAHIYGQFDAAMAEMREVGKAGVRPNGGGEEAAADAV